MKKKIKIALCQVNPTIADIVGNTNIVINSLDKGSKLGIDVIVFPEMVITGYPAQDLLFRPEIIESNLYALEKIVSHTNSYMAVVIGYCQPSSDYNLHKKEIAIDKQHLYNAYAVFSYGKVIGNGAKICLPNYSVFDDFRYFIPATETKVFNIDGVNIGIEICEDMWYTNDSEDHPIYPCRPTKMLSEKGSDIILVLNASPYYVGKETIKENLIRKQAMDNKTPIFSVNMWGGNDKIIFDGNSIASDKFGNIIARGKSFCDDFVICDFDLISKTGINIPASTCSAEENIYNALVLGKRDYHKKCSIQKSVIGVSGGIDSATVLAIDVAALSKENVLAIISPSRYTSEGTLSDAIKLCQNFEVEFLIIPIEEKSPSGEWIGAIPEKNKRFIKYFGKPHKEIVFENQQAIDRMSILRSIANEDNRLISGTGNKTELATGYATVCGDLQADILVIGDLYKHQVFSLAKHINKFYNKEMIPETIINRIPSAELSENQVDPFDYTRIDELVRLKIEEYVPDSEIVNYSPKNQSPFTEEEIKRISSLIDINEHKRFKSGYILKISRIAFGEDRRVNTAKKINLF